VHAVIEFISGPLRSARRGDYRILLRVDDERCTVLVVDIDHRAHIYRT